MKCIVIAEAGVNHNGNIECAKKMIEVAAEAGADYIKFQTFSADRLVTKSAELANYQKLNSMESLFQYDMLKKLELTSADYQKLAAYCHSCGIKFLSTGFDIEDVLFLVTLGLDFIKIPSGEITNLAFLEKVAKLGKEVILSTGMSSLGEIEAAINVMENSGLGREDLIILHCTSNYPAPLDEVNLSAMKNIGKALQVRVGYSDHTLGINIAIAAAAMGACVIEKHFTLDRSMNGPDHSASLEPNELRSMITAIRELGLAMGNGIKGPTPSELQTRSIARRSLVASRNIEKGEIFSAKNVAAKRPGTGISPMRWHEVVGRFAQRSFLEDEQIEL